MKGEIISADVKDVKNPSTENFKKIKPEKEMSTKEVNDFWDSEFKKESDAAKNESEVKDGPKEFFDDNENKYREGDHLIPNNEYEINEYKYKTDDQGRIASAEGKIRIDPHTRNMEDVRSKGIQEYHKNDQQGHLIGLRFGGSDRLENLVPMEAKLNQGDYAKMEKTLADAAKDGADVRLKVEPVYEKDSTRPSEFKVSYSIDGDREVVVFRNESEAKV